jgi:hypothetical protein
VRRKGISPIRVVAGERFRTKKKAEKEAKAWNKAYEGSGIEFLVRKEGWRRKRILSAEPAKGLFCQCGT